MADTIKFSQLGEISRAQMSGSDYAVGYKANGDNKKWTFENQADFLLNDSEAGQEFQETFVKVQNTEPTDENNKIWIEETPENEVEVPTYDEFKDLSNLVSGVNEAVFNKLSATADQLSTYIPFTFSTFAGKRYIIKNESSAGGMLARIRQTRDGENGTYITNGTQAGQTSIYEAAEDADYIAVMFGPTTTNPAFSIIQEDDVSSKVEDLKSALSNINDIVYAFEPASIYATASGWRLNESNGLCSEASGYKMDKYAVTAGQIVKVVSDDRFQFQNSSSVPSTAPNNRVGGITYGSGEFYLKVPQSATYLIISTVSENSSASVSMGTPISVTVDDIASNSEYGDTYNSTGISQNSNDIESILVGSRSIERDIDEYLYSGDFFAETPIKDQYRVYTDFIDNSADNDFTFYYDSSEYLINILRYNSNKEYVGQTGFVDIQPIRIRSYMTDPYIRITMKRADAAIIDRENVRLYSKKTFANNIVYNSDLSFIVKTNTITVKKDGTGDFTTIKGALTSISDNSFYNRYVVEIYEGTYDLKSEYSAEWGTSGFIGCTVPPFVKLKGVGKRDSIILTAEDTTTDESLRILMATINLYQSSELENLTIKGEGLKYTVHDDFNSDKLDRSREITDVTVLGDNPLTAAIWGAGAWAGTKTKFKNCTWSSNNKIAPFYMHNNTSAEEPSYIEFENCRFKSYNTSFGDCRLFLSTANNPNHAECYCTLIGTKVRSVYMATEGTATAIDWKVSGFGNETDGAIITVEGYSDNVDLIGTSQYSRYADGAY